MNTKIILLALLIGVSAPQMALAQEDGGDRRGMLKQKMQGRLQQMDSNGDGNLSKDEFMAHAEERFNKMDGNGDGMITPDERASMKQKFKQGHGGGGLGGEQFP